MYVCIYTNCHKKHLLMPRWLFSLPAYGRLWQPVAACGAGVLSLIVFYALRIEAWELQSRRPGLMSWLVDPAVLDGLAD